MDNIIFLSAQPDEIYFHWQIEVYLSNFIRMGILPSNIHTLIAINKEPSYEILEIEKKYQSHFFYYKKSDFDNFGYEPMLRPDIIYQHFIKNESLGNNIIFYHDSDIIFRELPDFSKLVNDKKWYLSNTISYIGSEYIKSKGNGLLEEMCSVADIDKSLVVQNELNSGGAQYLLKNINASFWRDVMIRTLDIWRFLSKRENRERFLLRNDINSYNPIQKWCSDMWGIYWSGLKLGHDIEVHSELDFSWATDNASKWLESKIYHNAGVVDDVNGTIFQKGLYHKRTPWLDDFSRIDQNSNTFNYVSEILKIKRTSHN